MGQFSAILCLVFVLRIDQLSLYRTSTCTVVQGSNVQGVASSIPDSGSCRFSSYCNFPTVSSPASAPSKFATPPTSTTSPAAQTPSSGPSAKGPATALPPSTSSGVVSIPNIEQMAIFGTALLGGVAFLL